MIDQKQHWTLHLTSLTLEDAVRTRRTRSGAPGGRRTGLHEHAGATAHCDYLIALREVIEWLETSDEVVH